MSHNATPPSHDRTMPHSLFHPCSLRNRLFLNYLHAWCRRHENCQCQKMACLSVPRHAKKRVPGAAHEENRMDAGRSLQLAESRISQAKRQRWLALACRGMGARSRSRLAWWTSGGPGIHAEIPYGTHVAGDCRHLEEDPTEMQVLNCLAEMVVQDLSYNRMAEALNQRGFHTRDAKPWNAVAVFKLTPRLIEVAPRILSGAEWETAEKAILPGRLEFLTTIASK